VPGSRAADPAGRTSDQDDLAVKGSHQSLQSRMKIVDNNLYDQHAHVKTVGNP
jgi:hypothetical protein